MLNILRNPYRAALLGTRASRGLAHAMIAITASVGLMELIACTRAPRDPSLPKDAQKSQNLSAWQRVFGAWKESNDIALGKRGIYPFDNKGKERVLQANEKALKDIETMRKTKELSEAEAGLLRKEMERLNEAVDSKRPTEMQDATCYMGMYFNPITVSIERLQAVLPFLEKAAAGDRLRPEVLEKVIANIQRDLDTLGTGKVQTPEDPAARKLREETRKQVQACLDQIRLKSKS